MYTVNVSKLFTNIVTYLIDFSKHLFVIGYWKSYRLTPSSDDDENENEDEDMSPAAGPSASSELDSFIIVNSVLHDIDTYGISSSRGDISYMPSI